MLFEESLKNFFGWLIDDDLRDFIDLKIFRANDLIGMIWDRFFETVCTNGMSAFKTIRKSKRWTEPVGAEGTFKLINMEDFHNV